MTGADDLAEARDGAPPGIVRLTAGLGLYLLR